MRACVKVRELRVVVFVFNAINNENLKSAILSIVLPHLPEVSSRHPAPGAEWPRVTHERVKGWRDEGRGGGQETSN